MKVDCVCEVCRKPFLARRNSRFCSGTCRQRHRRGVTEVKLDPSVTEEQSSVTSLSKDELYFKIAQYKHDTWKHSLEFKELKRRLKSMTVEELKEQGYFVPVWKEHGVDDPNPS